LSESIGILLLPAFAALTSIMLKVADFAKEHSTLIVILGGVIGGLAATILIANAAMKAYQAIQILIAAKTAIVTAATAAWNAVLYANPIGLVVIAIAALVAALVLAYNKSETFRKGVDAMFKFIKTAIETSVNFIKGYLNTVLGFYKSIFNGIAKLWNNTVGKLSFSVPSWVPGLGGKGFSVPQIPMLAEGGIVTGPTLAMIGEAGPEAVIPLNRAHGMGNVTININANIADERLGDVIVNALRQYNRRSGPANILVA
jgi:gas vesicle protein